LVAELVPQLLVAVTLIVPPVVPTEAVMEAVVELPDQPEGNVQTYELAPATEAAVYVSLVPEHTVVEPEMDAGAVGTVFTVTANV